MYTRYVRRERVSLQKLQTKEGSAYQIHIQKELIACLVGGYIDGEPFVSVSTCSKHDQFSRKLGRKIAVGRFERGIEGNIPSKYRKYILPEIEKLYNFLANNILQEMVV